MIPLACARCGGAMSPDDAALRRGVLTCGHCGSISALRGGEEAEVAPAARRGVPEGLLIVEKDGRLEVRAPKMRNNVFIARRELIAAGVVGAVVMVAFGLSLVPSLLVAGAVAVVGGLLRRTTPPLVLDATGLHASRQLGSQVVRPADVQQIYTARVALRTQGAAEVVNVNLWAVLRDGRRVHLMGPLRDAEVALHVEELLELRLGLRQRAVFGEAGGAEVNEAARPAEVAAALRAQGLAAGDEPAPVGAIACRGCGSRVQPGADDQRRGYASCAACQNLVLLFDPDDPRLLGVGPEEAARGQERERRYRLDRAGGATRLVRAGDGRVVIERTAAGDLVWSPESAREREQVAAARIGAVTVRPIAVDLMKGFAGMVERMAFSGSGDMRSMMADQLAGRFAVEVRLRDGRRLSVADDVPSAWEGLLIAQALGPTGAPVAWSQHEA